MQSTTSRRSQNAHFVPREHHTASFTDLTEDAFDQKIAVFHVQRFWDLDLSKVTFSGFTMDDANMRRVLAVNVRNAEGDIVREAEFDAPMSAMLDVRVNPGCEWQDAVRDDMLGDLQVQFLNRMGLPEDFPCACEAHVRKDLSLSVVITPLL